MKIKNSVVGLVVILTMLIGCRPKPLELELEQLEQKPVLWTQAVPNNLQDVILVYFSRSFSALETNESETTNADLLNQILVEEGSMTLEHNGNIEELTQLTSGIWTSLETPLIVGDTYTIKATDNELQKNIESTTQMMPTITMESTIDYTITEIDSLNILTLDYTINDVPGDNWYLINVYSNLNNFLLNTDTIPDTTANDIDAVTQLVTDQIFDSFSIENSIEIYDVEPNIDTLYISLSNITEEYYNYLSLRERGGSIFNQITNEPINYPTNVEGGYGYFNLVIPDIKTVYLEQ